MTTTATKSTKNENSIREVPIHRMLFDIGFDDFLKFRQASKSTRLFPDFGKSPSDGSWSKTFSAWFTRYRREMAVERIIAGKNRVDFHSFRHVFEDVIRDLPDVKKGMARRPSGAWRGRQLRRLWPRCAASTSERSHAENQVERHRSFAPSTIRRIVALTKPVCWIFKLGRFQSQFSYSPLRVFLPKGWWTTPGPINQRTSRPR